MINRPATPMTRSSTDTRGRIVEAARDCFAEKGYSQTGMREIAQRAGVATSLLTKYFGHKRKLFEEALVNTLVSPTTLQGDRSTFGKALTQTLLGPTRTMNVAAMIALSLGDGDAREVAVHVSEQHIIQPLADWLGPPDAHARATNIMMMAAGFTIFHRNVDMGQSEASRRGTAAVFAEAIQAIVDGKMPA